MEGSGEGVAGAERRRSKTKTLSRAPKRPRALYLGVPLPHARGTSHPHLFTRLMGRPIVGLWPGGGCGSGCEAYGAGDRDARAVRPMRGKNALPLSHAPLSLSPLPPYRQAEDNGDTVTFMFESPKQVSRPRRWVRARGRRSEKKERRAPFEWVCARDAAQPHPTRAGLRAAAHPWPPRLREPDEWGS